MDKVAFLQQFISSYISGPNANALIEALAIDAQAQDDLSVAVNDQLTISTSSDVYLDLRLSELDITRPSSLGMDDLSFQNMGIAINAQKQIIQVVHTILSTFYGDDTTRAFTQSGQEEPFNLADGQILQVSWEDGSVRNIVFNASDFRDINQATAQEVCDVVTRYTLAIGLQGYAQVYQDFNTGLNYVRIYGGARGPYSLVRIAGGEVQDALEFPTLRATNLSPLANNTVWEVTRTTGFTLRFRWVSGNQPNLSQVLVGDTVMLYGEDFITNGLNGSFVITNVRPPKIATDLNAGWFELSDPLIATLKSTPAGQAPLPNSPGNTYSYTVTQTSYYDTKFFESKKNTAYSTIRYALGFEPADSLLKIYIPATTMVVRRALIGAAHVHMLYGSTDMDGTYGSATDPTQQIQIVNSMAFSYPQDGEDNSATGGTASYGATTVGIEFSEREGRVTTVHTLTPHGLIGNTEWSGSANYSIGAVVWYEGSNWTALAASGPGHGGAVTPSQLAPGWHLDGAAPNFTTTQVSIQDTTVLIDDTTNPFLGPYSFDPTAQYQLTNEIVNSREEIVQGIPRRTLFVSGVIPNQPSIALIDLNKDTQEGPIPIIGAEGQSLPQAVNITSISQNGFQIIVKTAQPHQAIPGSNVIIAGTVNFNGLYAVASVPTSTTYIATSGTSQIAVESTGTSTTQVNVPTSTIILDESYQFKFDHDIGADLTIISSDTPVVPAVNGTDYPFYVTGTANGRDFLVTLLQQITALGINLEIIVVYPNDKGLGNAGDSTITPPLSDAVYVWGDDNAV